MVTPIALQSRPVFRVLLSDCEASKPVFNSHSSCMVWLAAEVVMSAATVVASMVEHAPEDMLNSFVEPILALPTAAQKVSLQCSVSTDGFRLSEVGAFMLHCR